jgi:hypothetical protein
MNPAKNKEISQREKEFKNLQNNFFQLEKHEEQKIFYNPNLEELRKNTSVKTKILKGFIFCNYNLINLE